MTSRRGDGRRVVATSDASSLRPGGDISPGESYLADTVKKQRRVVSRAIWRHRLGGQLCFTVSMIAMLAPVLYLTFMHLQPLAPGPAMTNGPQTMLYDTAAGEAAESRRPDAWQVATDLVVVAGHAIYTGNRFERSDIRNEKNWYLEPQQKGMVDTFLDHIRKGVELAANNTHSLLVFSGGVTRPGVGPRSEAVSYWQAAESFDWFGSAHSVKNRSHVEEFARDSLENLLFSICRFKQLTGRYPHRVLVVSFDVKRERFESIHRQALRFPRKRFLFYGIDPPNESGIRGILSARERAKSLGPFGKDPYACHIQSLHAKRLDRNPSLRFHPYPQGCPELSALFQHCGSKIFSGSLPWDRRITATGAPITTAAATE